MILVRIESLLHHEKTSKKRLREVKGNIKKTGVLQRPILVDKKTKTILDGHHRVLALSSLGARKVPAILVDYENDPILIVSRKKGKNISKADVLFAALKNNPFPPKSSRHLYDRSIKVNAPLESLI